MAVMPRRVDDGDDENGFSSDKRYDREKVAGKPIESRAASHEAKATTGFSGRLRGVRLRF
jgi:hypothetical protein